MYKATIFIILSLSSFDNIIVIVNKKDISTVTTQMLNNRHIEEDIEYLIMKGIIGNIKIHKIYGTQTSFR